MKKLALSALALCLFAAPVAAKAGVCAYKPEAESVKEPLPLKYKKLKEENQRLKQELANCMAEKASVRNSIAELQAQISELEDEKVQLQNQLRVLPSKEELLREIQQLEAKLGR